MQAAELLEELRAKFVARGEKPGIRMIWQVAPDLPPFSTDRTKLTIILKNLVLNALKFTDAGEVRLTIFAERDGIAFNVSDTGVGIAPEILPLIFEPFRQQEKPATWRHGGVGLGLHVVRRFVEILGGSVSASSEVGKGSVFRVWLPRKATR